MTDYFDIDGKVDDRILALSRVLCDPNLRRDVKVAEIASVFRRIETLEDQRETATTLSVISDALAAPARPECGQPADDGSGRVCRRLCAPGRDYHGGGHWYADPDLDGERVRHSTARWIVTGEQPSDALAAPPGGEAA